jgi:hypothetical protein
VVFERRKAAAALQRGRGTSPVRGTTSATTFALLDPCARATRSGKRAQAGGTSPRGLAAGPFVAEDRKAPCKHTRSPSPNPSILITTLARRA